MLSTTDHKAENQNRDPSCLFRRHRTYCYQYSHLKPNTNTDWKFNSKLVAWYKLKLEAGEDRAGYILFRRRVQGGREGVQFNFQVKSRLQEGGGGGGV